MCDRSNLITNTTGSTLHVLLGGGQERMEYGCIHKQPKKMVYEVETIVSRSPVYIGSTAVLGNMESYIYTN